MHKDEQSQRPFAELARTTKSSLLRDVLGLLAVTKKWWLLPVLVMLLLISGLLLSSSTVVVPFIYTLF